MDSFQIMIGTQGNSEVKISDQLITNEQGTYTTPLYHGQVLSDEEFRTFWINVKNGEYTVGYGAEPYRTIIVADRFDT